MPVLKNPPPVSVPQMLVLTANGALQMKAAWIGPVTDLGPVVQKLRDCANNPLGDYKPSKAAPAVEPVRSGHHTKAAAAKYPTSAFYTDGRMNEQYVHDTIADSIDCTDLVVVSHASTVGSSSHMKADETTKNFGDYDSNPLGGSRENVTTVDLSQEFSAAKAALGGLKK